MKSFAQHVGRLAFGAVLDERDHDVLVTLEEGAGQRRVASALHQARIGAPGEQQLGQLIGCGV